MSQREFENDIPLDDPVVVLDLLCGPYSEYMTTREVLRYHRRSNRAPYVRIGYHHDFSASRVYDFLVTDRVVDQLLAGGFLQGKPHWGYTDMNELTASEGGRLRILEERHRLGLDERIRSERWIMGR
jgi:hypothetical protein